MSFGGKLIAALILASVLSFGNIVLGSLFNTSRLTPERGRAVRTSAFWFALGCSLPFCFFGILFRLFTMFEGRGGNVAATIFFVYWLGGGWALCRYGDKLPFVGPRFRAYLVHMRRRESMTRTEPLTPPLNLSDPK